MLKLTIILLLLQYLSFKGFSTQDSQFRTAKKLKELCCKRGLDWGSSTRFAGDCRRVPYYCHPRQIIGNSFEGCCRSAARKKICSLVNTDVKLISCLNSGHQLMAYGHDAYKVCCNYCRLGYHFGQFYDNETQCGHKFGRIKGNYDEDLIDLGKQMFTFCCGKQVELNQMDLTVDNVYYNMAKVDYNITMTTSDPEVPETTTLKEDDLNSIITENSIYMVSSEMPSTAESSTRYIPETKTTDGRSTSISIGFIEPLITESQLSNLVDELVDAKTTINGFVGIESTFGVYETTSSTDIIVSEVATKKCGWWDVFCK